MLLLRLNQERTQQLNKDVDELRRVSRMKLFSKKGMKQLRLQEGNGQKEERGRCGMGKQEKEKTDKRTG